VKCARSNAKHARGIVSDEETLGFRSLDITTEKDALQTGKKLEEHWRELAEQEAANETAAGGKFATEPVGVDQDDIRRAPAKHLS
jgi:hypothetical protein